MSGYFSSAARALTTTLGNLFRKPVTVQFPKVIRPRAERYRSSFALLHDEDGDEACIGCLQCERICPSQVISIKVGGKRESPVTGKKRGYADDFVLDLNACIYCELCVQVCPTDAIVMTRQPELPAYGREDLVLTMAKLYANEKSKERSWGDATRLNAMQTPPKPPKTDAPAAPAATTNRPLAPPATSAAPATPAPTGSPVPATARSAEPSGAATGSTGAPASPPPSRVSATGSLASPSDASAEGASAMGPPASVPGVAPTPVPAHGASGAPASTEAHATSDGTRPPAGTDETGSTPPSSTGEGKQ